MNYIKQNHLSLLIFLWLLVSSIGGGLSFGGTPQDLTTSGNPFFFSNTSSNGGVRIASSTATTQKVGASGTGLTLISAGSCALIYSNKSITASTTRTFDCLVTGAIAGDKILFQFSTTTEPALGWVLVGGSASSTSGYGTLQIGNWTGGTAALPREIASSTAYFLFR